MSEQSEKSCCTSQTITPSPCCGEKGPTTDRFVRMGDLRVPSPAVQHVGTGWSRADRWGAFRSRISAFRMQYRVEPGLYAVGSPDKTSDVFVSANYKLSFDHLRRALKGRDAWIVVLDTKGINVWCAAGKGTFGTEELIRRIRAVGLDRVVEHRRVIVPQLGAVGVAAHVVKKETGFRVLFGPVAAKDIPTFIDAGYRATREMRKVRFSMWDRLVLTPMELNPAMKKFPYFLVGVFLLFGLQREGILFRPAWDGGLSFVILGLVSVLAGTVFMPILLPYLPTPSFGIKGWIAGLLSTCATFLAGGVPLRSVLLSLVALILFPAASSYLALNFTGSTPYTGMSGVEKELKRALPLYFTALVLSALFLIIYKVRTWG
ncbi:MAG: acetyl-CoA synthase subunit gamma [Deltaproteobacteria bacterium]|nr:acetyl-CoA synthase subunit gamma [Deltaproteobacteria bacterium]